ncbi:MAG TPA: hypothetical protein VHG08_09485, partial [Longimicrobium sp.]|nr:hypothetical protein [Longimicrobium sp.]
GMSRVSECTIFGDARVTQTQTADVAGQLAVGVRYFDLRPAVWKVTDDSPTLYTGHFSSAAGGQGCLGEKLSDILDAVARFMQSTQDEIVILKFSHYGDSDTRAFPPALQQRMIALVQGTLHSWMLTAQVGEKAGRLTVGQVIDGGKRVLCVFDGLAPDLYDPANGILQYGSVDPANPDALQQTNLDVYDSYTGTENTVMMMADQLFKYRQFTRAPLDDGEFFLLSYTLTLSDLDSTPAGSGSILELAAKANQWLWQYTTGLFPPSSPARPPNFIYVDAVDAATPLRAALYCNAMAAAPPA